ncbi:MAG: hypothetical protein Q4Q58_05335 [Thermoplasmata archaeon]|nr:hypothetical protein [Thermoplasmata archaeon]
MARTYELGKSGIAYKVSGEDTLGHTPTLALVYGILSVLLAAVLAAAAMVGVTVGEGSSVSQEVMDATLTWWPIAAGVSGVTAVIAGMLARRRERWQLCMACMAVAVFAVLLYMVPTVQIALISLILLAVGVVMMARINKNRHAFSG